LIKAVITGEWRNLWKPSKNYYPKRLNGHVHWPVNLDWIVHRFELSNEPILKPEYF
jgi:hypothetical protein